MDPSQLPHLPDHIRRITLQQNEQCMRYIEEEANRRALMEKPLPHKTVCKWTKEQRKRNNKLSVARSRVREREHIKLLEEELERCLLERQQLEGRLHSRTMRPQAALSAPTHIAQPGAHQLLHSEQYHVMHNERNVLEDPSSEWDLFPDEQQVQNVFSPSSSAEVFQEHDDIDTLP